MPSLNDMAAHQAQAVGHAGNREEALFSGFSFANAPDIYGDKKNILAQDIQFAPMPTLVPNPEQLGFTKPVLDAIGHASDAVGETAESAELRLEQQWNPKRGHIFETMAAIPDASWTEAYKAFPQFRQSGMTEQQTKELMQAIIRNELYNFDKIDEADDNHARQTGSPMHFPQRHDDKDATLGVTQLSINAVEKRIAEYPQPLKSLAGHEVQALLDPAKAPLLVAATLAHDIEMFHRHRVPVTERSLAYIYNADVLKNGKKVLLPTEQDLHSSVHVRNVVRQLEIVRGLETPKLGEL